MRLALLFVSTLIIGALGGRTISNGETTDPKATIEKFIPDQTLSSNHVNGPSKAKRKTQSDEKQTNTGNRGEGACYNQDEVPGEIDRNGGAGQGKKQGGGEEAIGKKESKKGESGTREKKEDRRWIIKQGSPVKPNISTSPKPVEWKSETQKKRCSAHLKGLEENLGNARYYSIQGDSCATAQYAKSFGDLVDRCKRECPEGYLQTRGYSEKIIKNLNVLMVLGRKRCLDNR